MFELLNYRYIQKGGRLLFLVVICAFSMPLLSVQAKDTFTVVTPEQLLEYPQKYWSQAIIFEDKLKTAPKTKLISLGEKKYHPFTLAAIGRCYADRDIMTALRAAPLNTIYVFQGTVLHKPKSFFSRSPSFFIVVEQFTTKFDAVKEWKDKLQDKDAGGDNSATRLFSHVQQDLIAYAKANNIKFSDLFAEDFKDSPSVKNVISSAIIQEEQANKTSAQGLLRDFIVDVFYAEYGSGGGAPTILVDTSDAGSPDVALKEVTPDSKVFSGIMSDETGLQEDKPVVSSNEEANLDALKKRAVIMLKPGIRAKMK